MRLNCKLVNDEVQLFPDFDLLSGDIYLNWALEKQVCMMKCKNTGTNPQKPLSLGTMLCGTGGNMTTMVLCN